jgi:hypothetical protein
VTVRIAIYCPSFDEVSGVREVVRQLSADMARGNAVAVVARTRRGAIDPPATESGVTVDALAASPAAYERAIDASATAGSSTGSTRPW